MSGCSTTISAAGGAAVREQLEIAYDLPEEGQGSGRKQERRESCEIATATPHTFRRSVGTFIGETVSVDQAAQQLGHKRTAVTIRSYLRERQEASDSSGHLASVMYKPDQPPAPAVPNAPEYWI